MTRRTPPGAARAQLEAAAGEAVRFLLGILADEEEKTDLRIKCATALLDRAGEAEGEPEGIEVLLRDAEELAE